MKTIILLEKRTYLVRLAKMFQQKEEIEIKEIKKKIPSTIYYRDLLSKLVDINNILSNNKPGYFIRPTFIKKGGNVISGLKRHPYISIEVKDNFVVLSYEKD